MSDNLREQLAAIFIDYDQGKTPTFAEGDAAWKATVNDQNVNNARDYAVLRIQVLLDQSRTALLERIRRELFSGVGRETGVWHYEINEANDMEASYAGEYLSIREVREAINKIGGEL